MVGFQRSIARFAGKFPLQAVLIVPFVLQIVAAVGLVGYLSFKNGQQVVNEMATQLSTAVGERVNQELNHYLAIPHQINQLNLEAIELGMLNLQDFETMGRFFWKQMQIFNVGYINFGNQQKEFSGVERLEDGTLQRIETTLKQGTAKAYYYTTDAQGRRTHLIQVDDHTGDIRQEGWYTAAVAAGHPVWSQIYQWQDKPEVLSISSSYPVYGKTGQLVGVIGVDLLLPKIGEMLRSLQISSHGRTFIVERNGFLVAGSSGHPVFSVDHGEAHRLLAIDSADPLTQATARYLVQQFGGLGAIQQSQQLTPRFAGGRQFVQVTPWQDQQGLDWLIVVVVPESDFMGHIYANTQVTIVLCGIAFMVAIAGGMITARWITQPILQLNATAKKIARREWHHPQPLERVDAVGELAQSFQEMAAQLQASFSQMTLLNRALSQSEHRLTQFLEALPIGVVVHGTEGQVTYCNQTAAHLLGLSVIPETIGADLADTYHLYRIGTDQLYPLEDLPALRALRGENVIIEDIEFRHDGRVIPFELRATPIRDATGEIIYAVVVFQDIRERKQTQRLLEDYNRTLANQIAHRTEALRQSENQFRSAFETAAIGMCLVSIDGKILRVNASVCQIVGYSASELLNLHFQDITHPGDREFATIPQQQLLAGAIHYFHIEQRYLHKSGQTVWVHLSVSLIRNSQQQPLYFIAQLQDISDAKYSEAERQRVEAERQLATVALQEAKEAAEAANHAKSEFLARMSHELRTPLNAVLGFAQLMQCEAILTPEQQEHLTIITRSGEHLLALINDVLEMSKIESGQITLNSTTFDLHHLLTSLQNMLQLKAEAKGLSLCVQRSPTVPQLIHTDEVKLRQVLINLLGNAIKFTTTGAVTLTVDCTVHPGKSPPHPLISFEITDSGMGISLQDLSTIFAPFVQADAGRQSQEGTGLGLAISQKFVQLMGGKIQVRSVLGVGTTFSFEIPVLIQPPAETALDVFPQGLPAVTSPTGTAASSLRLLLAEDNPVNQKLGLRMLEKLDYTADLAKNGLEVLSALAASPYDIILMDVQMPEMDGLEATRQIRQQQNPGQCPLIIALTANAMQEDRDRCFAAGMDDYLSKPLRMEALQQTLNRAVASLGSRPPASR
ncbi:PAS domain S-box protein [Neosynechococcus sphagnicola]|uniref:PAS domain S-box protein n=1 Tax=Neosynechococcus sphagnicola TaxID=1501145 RepID=UPI00068C7C7E|nr:PAS domain S-box protein [Neosynechococcus sphagnicola]